MQRLDHYWYHNNPIAVLLRPLSWCFRGLASLRRNGYRLGLIKSVRLPVPVIVVGNISVGGTGKTPLVIALVEWLVQHGYQPGVITRGYGGEQRREPVLVNADSDPYSVSDEAVLLAKRTARPVAACADRIAASRLLLEQGCDIVLSDDGLQHYRLQRDVEIAVVDATRGVGNGFCLPAGPLREPKKRLKTVDFVIVNGSDRVDLGCDSHTMVLRAHSPRRLTDDEEQAITNFKGVTIHALAAIGNPKRFYDQLRSSGLSIIEHSFPDHHRYRAEDIEFADEYPVLMTEKDAVKCKKIVDSKRYWYVPVEAVLNEAFKQSLINRLKYKN